jgi:hypothetical protein
MTTRRIAVPLAFIIPAIIIGAIVTSYTSYVRYCLPLLTILPLIVMRDVMDARRKLAAKERFGLRVAPGGLGR